MFPDFGAALIAALLALTTPTATEPAVRTQTTVCVADADTCNPPITAPPSTDGPCGQWWPTALDAGWPENQRGTVLRVMRCESGCDPHAHNPSGASGLMQIMPMWWHGRDPYDPATNMEMAREVHDAQGWRAWSCF